MKTFTSESVCAGHPDKVCDQISDAIVDEILRQDPTGRVAVETVATFGKLYVAGEVNTTARVNYKKIAQKEIKRLGYTDPNLNFSDTSPIEIYVHEQSPEIAVGVDNEGAGDQGMMFGYACNETKNFMPLPIEISHQLAKKIDRARETAALPYLRPDGKTQATIEYDDGKPVACQTIVIAVPHHEDITLEQVHTDVYHHIVIPVLNEYNLTIPESALIVNGTGVWNYGGPAMDTGLTGRKIVVDTYGGYARVGGGAFSGKDPTKVDRSGAYAARFIAKNIVAAGLADKAEVRLAYFIGATKPLMQEVETFGTAKVDDKIIADFVHKLIDTSVSGIIEKLDLRRPIYRPSAAYGHFGRIEFPWEQLVN